MSATRGIEAAGLTIIAAGLLEVSLIYAARRKGKYSVARLITLGSVCTFALGLFILILPTLTM